MSLEKSDKSREYLESAFAAAIERSKPSIKAVADHIQSQGFEVHIPEIIVRDKIENRHRYADNGDLFYWKAGDINRRRVEVKHHESYIRPFNSLESFPFDYALIGRQHLIDRNFDKVHRYVIVSSDHKYGILIKPESRHAWFLQTMKKKNWGTIETDYYCPLEHTDIIKLVDL